MLSLQVKEVLEVIGTQDGDVTKIGILVGLVIIFGIVIYYREKRHDRLMAELRATLNKCNEARIIDEKENSKEYRDILKEQSKDMNRMINIVESLKK